MIGQELKQSEFQGRQLQITSMQRCDEGLSIEYEALRPGGLSIAGGERNRNGAWLFLDGQTRVVRCIGGHFRAPDNSCVDQSFRLVIIDEDREHFPLDFPQIEEHSVIVASLICAVNASTYPSALW